MTERHIAVLEVLTKFDEPMTPIEVFVECDFPFRDREQVSVCLRYLLRHDLVTRMPVVGASSFEYEPNWPEVQRLYGYQESPND